MTTALRYSQADGFTEIPEPIEWLPNETLERWLTRAGYGLHDDDGDRDGYHFVIYHRKPDCTVPYKHFVVIGTACTWDGVFVKNEADLLALRITTAPMVLLEAITHLEEMATAASRAFRAWHGHDSHNCCPHCAP